MRHPWPAEGAYVDILDSTLECVSKHEQWKTWRNLSSVASGKKLTVSNSWIKLSSDRLNYCPLSFITLLFPHIIPVFSSTLCSEIPQDDEETLGSKSFRVLLRYHHFVHSQRFEDNRESPQFYFKIPYIGRFSDITQNRVRKLINRLCKPIDIKLLFSTLKIKHLFNVQDPLPERICLRSVRNCDDLSFLKSFTRSSTVQYFSKNFCCCFLLSWGIDLGNQLCF